MVDHLVRVWMVLAAVVVGWQGMRYLIDPASVVAGVDVRASTIDELHVVRTGYGGGLVAVAAMTMLGAARRSLRTIGLGTMTVAMTALVGARLVSIAVDGRPADGLLRLLFVEAALLAGSAAALVFRRT